MRKSHRSFSLLIIRKMFVLLFFGPLLMTPVLAQVDRAELEGTVTDQSGAAVAGADVKILAAHRHRAGTEQQFKGLLPLSWPGCWSLHSDGYQYWLQDQGD